MHVPFEDSLSNARSNYLSIEMMHEMADDEPAHVGRVLTLETSFNKMKS